MKIIKYKVHEWEECEDGQINEYASTYEYCNGPRCIHCYHSFCVHCNPGGYSDAESEPCIRHVCQDCDERVSTVDKLENAEQIWQEKS